MIRFWWYPLSNWDGKLTSLQTLMHAFMNNRWRSTCVHVNTYTIKRKALLGVRVKRQVSRKLIFNFFNLASATCQIRNFVNNLTINKISYRMRNEWVYPNYISAFNCCFFFLHYVLVKLELSELDMNKSWERIAK